MMPETLGEDQGPWGGPDIAVIGAGPAGLSAAIAAAEAGARVAVYDENDTAGGQLFKQIHKFFGSKEHHAGVRGFQIGRRLVDRAMRAGVDLLLSTVVFGIYPGPKLGIYTLGTPARYVKPRGIILAVGATERSLPFPGWTLPGVMGAGAAQTLMNIHRVLPGKRVLMVGSGNVGLIVSHQLLQAGAEVAAIIEAAPNVGGYEVHAAKLRRRGVPIHVAHSVARAEGDQAVEAAIIARMAPGGGFEPGSEKRFAVDLILLAVGLTPQIELAQMAGCELDWQPAWGGHVVTCDDNMRTSVPGVYCAGDIARTEEAATAIEEGTLAGLACAESLGHIPAELAREGKCQCRHRLAGLRGELPAAAPPVAEPVPANPPAAGPSPGRAVAVIECYHNIPCNPCEAACRFGAIVVGDDITAPPRLDPTKCTGCGQCITQCPGLAIFTVLQEEHTGMAAVSVPYELGDLPREGEMVTGLSREGEPICRAEVSRVQTGQEKGHTAVVTLRVPLQFSGTVRAFRREKP